MRPTEPSALAAARRTHHSSAKEARRPCSPMGSGTGIASAPAAASCSKGASGNEGCASLSSAPAEILARVTSRSWASPGESRSSLPGLKILIMTILYARGRPVQRERSHTLDPPDAAFRRPEVGVGLRQGMVELTQLRGLEAAGPDQRDERI